MTSYKTTPRHLIAKVCGFALSLLVALFLAAPMTMLHTTPEAGANSAQEPRGGEVSITIGNTTYMRNARSKEPLNVNEAWIDKPMEISYSGAQGSYIEIKGKNKLSPGDSTTFELRDLNEQKDIGLHYQGVTTNFTVVFTPPKDIEIQTESDGSDSKYLYTASIYGTLENNKGGHIVEYDSEGKIKYYNTKHDGVLANFNHMYKNDFLGYTFFEQNDEDKLYKSNAWTYGNYVITDNHHKIVDRVSMKNTGKYPDRDTSGAEMHDIAVLGERDYIILNYVPVDYEDDKVVMTTHVQRITEGKAAWEWSSDDDPLLYSQAREIPEDEREMPIIDGKKVLDNLHANSLGVTPGRDGVVVGFRKTDSLVKVGFSDHSVQWTLGGKHNDFNLNGLSFAKQHHGHFGKDGKFYIFDNGELGKDGHSRGLRFDLDEETKTISNVEEFGDKETMGLYTGSTSQVERSGNVVVGWGMSKNHPNAIASVFDKDGKVINTLSSPRGVDTYRVTAHPSRDSGLTKNPVLYSLTDLKTWVHLLAPIVYIVILVVFIYAMATK